MTESGTRSRLPSSLAGAAIAAILLVGRAGAAPDLPAAAPAYEVHAVRFATLPAYRVASLVAGADRDLRMDLAMMVWVVRGGGRTLLVDAGFHREKFITQWQPRDYVRPADAVRAGLGIDPAAVTDVVLTHVHWDHADGADLFPNARVWIQRAEYEHHVGEQGGPADRAIDPGVASMLFAIRQAGRLELVGGDDREIIPGIRVYTGGRHTFASQYVSVATPKGVVVLASDNAYLYENLEQKRAIAQTLDAASNLAAQSRMLQLAGGVARVVPGHDPAVFERFATVTAGVVRIQ
jgi:glyoxylase-like metal-dependent hydrolase (beta-lactamase superfamily II)